MEQCASFLSSFWLLALMGALLPTLVDLTPSMLALFCGFAMTSRMQVFVLVQYRISCTHECFHAFRVVVASAVIMFFDGVERQGLNAAITTVEPPSILVAQTTSPTGLSGLVHCSLEKLVNYTKPFNNKVNPR